MLPDTPDELFVSSLLSITNLTTRFKGPLHTSTAVDSITLSIGTGQSVALVGESGSGKSMTALSIMRLIPSPGFIASGRIDFEGQNLVDISDLEMRSIRGRRISMIFQEPMTSLNPVLRIGEQVSEPFMLHHKISRREADQRSSELLHNVGFASASERMRDYPHQLSGGMRQRVMIAMALACNPALLIADEPTTALDVTIQAQILELIDSFRVGSNMGLLLITHDLGIVAERSDHTCVMYAGYIVEEAPTRELLDNPRHPYTQALLASLPQHAIPGQPLATIPGQLSPIADPRRGCSFSDRCSHAMPQCTSDNPPMHEVAPGHTVRCWL
jgi:peptide/nickel transport system ATP-binding protein